MVLINGVKYACERCIRGHRVTTCTHTDQPLTMIKPKGRPASQCSFCREQRKLKNTHTRCSCGKKGKSPGTHLASCVCHKNTQCTCCIPSVKKGDKSKKKVIKTDVSTNNEKGTSIANGNIGSSYNSPGLPSSFIMEDIPVPFEPGHGLFDFFSSSLSSSSNVNLDNKNEISNSNSISPSDSSSINLNSKPTKASNNAIEERSNDLNVQIVDNMFPLFPLVGTQSFDDSKSQPLSSIPPSTSDTFSDGSIGERYENNPKSSKNGTSFTSQDKNPFQHNTPRQTAHYQPIRPKRPESVLSMASTSSTGTNASRNFESFTNLGHLSNQTNQTNYSPSVTANFELENGVKNNSNGKDSKTQKFDFFDNIPQKNNVALDKIDQINESNMSDVGLSENETASLDKHSGSNPSTSPKKGNQDSVDFDFSIPLLNDFLPPIYDQRADLHS